NMREIERLVQPLRDSGEVVATFANTGGGGSVNSGFMAMTLAPWSERTRSQAEILADVQSRIAAVPGVRAFAFQPNSPGIRGAGSGLQFTAIGSNYADLTRE